MVLVPGSVLWAVLTTGTVIPLPPVRVPLAGGNPTWTPAREPGSHPASAKP